MSKETKKEWIDGYLQDVVPPSVTAHITDESVITLPQDVQSILFIGDETGPAEFAEKWKDMIPGDNDLKLTSLDVSNATVQESLTIQCTEPLKRMIVDVTINGPKSFSKVFQGSLSRDEIKMLPFELKVCWMFQSWNKGFVPRSIEEWAKGIGFLAFREYEYGENDYDMDKARTNAVNAVNKTIDFIKNAIMNPDITEKETDYIKEIKARFDDGKPADEQTRYNWY